MCVNVFLDRGIYENCVIFSKIYCMFCKCLNKER